MVHAAEEVANEGFNRRGKRMDGWGEGWKANNSRTIWTYGIHIPPYPSSSASSSMFVGCEQSGNEKERTSLPLHGETMDTYHVDELRQLELDPDRESVCGVDDRAHQLVVVGEEVVVEALGIGVASVERRGGPRRRRRQRQQRPQQQRHCDGPRHGAGAAQLRVKRRTPEGNDADHGGGGGSGVTSNTITLSRRTLALRRRPRLMRHQHRRAVRWWRTRHPPPAKRRLTHFGANSPVRASLSRDFVHNHSLSDRRIISSSSLSFLPLFSV